MKTRHLTIMFTDIKGFTPRASKSSREQLSKLLELHENLVMPVFKEFGGRVIKTFGDSFMVSFHSPTDAVLCGIKIQDVLEKYNEKLDKEEKLEVRIAINSGEVTLKNKDIFGEAVNIASRLEGIADAGDIFFTESVYLTMNKNEIPTAEVGHRHFRGIPEEIKVYRVVREGKRKGLFKKKDKIIEREYYPKKRRFPRILKWALIIFLILFVIGLIGSMSKQKEKDFAKDRGLKIEQIKQELESIYADTQGAIEMGDEIRASNGIEKLIRRSRELNNPPELENAINDLKIMYDERFR